MKSATSIWSRLGDLAGLVATPLVPSHYVELVRPLAATHNRRARIEAVRRETADSRTLVLRPGRGFRPHRAGQHVRVTVEVDGRLATRTYSISSPPERGDGCIAITVKAQPGGRVSRALVHGAALGGYVALGQPEGDFVLPDGVMPLPSLLVTAGSGITPAMAMLRSLAARGELPDIAHVHHARSEADVIFGAELRALAAAHPRYRLVIVHTASDPRRLDRARLDELVPDWRVRETWACGPQRLLDAIIACFAEAGRGDALHVERFAAALAPPPTDATGGVVRLGRAAVTRSDGRTSLLQVAESAGVLARHGCRMGICHSCDTTLLAGRVRDLRTGEEISEPGARVQICVCAAAGDVDLDL